MLIGLEPAQDIGKKSRMRTKVNLLNGLRNFQSTWTPRGGGGNSPERSRLRLRRSSRRLRSASMPGLRDLH